MTQPSFFISHGAPDVAIRPSPVADFLRAFGAQHERPDAIIVASAHYETDIPEVGAALKPETIHDFGGFQPELYRMHYKAPGAPDLSAEVADALKDAGFETRINTGRGFDHGIWTPLILAYPDADIPIIPLSVQPHEDAAHHFRMGRALEKFRERNILVAGSGHITHNLRAMFHAMRGGSLGPDVEAAVSGFTGWVGEKLRNGEQSELLSWEDRAPFALENHPTPEHFLPFYVAYGAGGEHAEAELAHSSKLFGAFNSDFWLFH